MKINCQYQIREEKKENLIEHSSSLCHGHRHTIKKSSSRQF